MTKIEEDRQMRYERDVKITIDRMSKENEALAITLRQSQDQLLKMQNRIHELEAENKALKANALDWKLENAIEILGDLGIRNCPMLTVNGYDCSNGKGCKHYHENTPTDTYACWTEYFNKGDKP